MSEVARISSEQNPKQLEFWNDFWTEVARYEAGDVENPIRYWFYGGSIRGGKTFLTLILLTILCKRYPTSKWHVIRRSTPDLLNTTVPSLEKIVGKSGATWKRSAGEYYCQFPNGSRIYFMAESFNSDKDLDRFKGLETNGILLEQVEELQEATYNKALERIGSWYCAKQPPALLFATFNPTFNWVKKRLYDEWMLNGCEPPYYFMTALPTDNASVTADQWQAWKQLDTETYKRFIEGVWELEVNGQFFSAFDQTRHIGRVTLDPSQPIWLSFDFNVDPMTCIVFQSDGESWARVLKEYRQPNSDTYAMCRAILADYPDISKMSAFVTGDASGGNRMSGTRNHVNQYSIIKEELGLGWSNFKVPKVNPSISASRAFVNSCMTALQEFTVDRENCPYLIDDLRFVLTTLDHKGELTIAKTGMNKFANMDNKHLTHLSDCLRYVLHTALRDFVKIPKS